MKKSDNVDRCNSVITKSQERNAKISDDVDRYNSVVSSSSPESESEDFVPLKDALVSYCCCWTTSMVCSACSMKITDRIHWGGP